MRTSFSSYERPGAGAPPVSPILLKSGFTFWRPGYYYDQRVSGTAATATGSGVAARLNYTPVIVPRDLTVDRIAIYVTTASGTAGAFARLGLYNSTVTGTISTLLVDAGTVTTDVIGVREIAISQPLTAGMYWTAIWVKDGTSFQCACLPAAQQLAVTGQSAPLNGAPVSCGYMVTQAGLLALPPAGGGSDAGGTPPAVWLRVTP
jgi:hypothetical protein